MMKLIKKLFRWINLLVVGGTVLAFLAPYISPTTFWPISFFGLGMPVFLVLNVVFLVIFFLLKSKKGWYLNVLCLGISLLFIGKSIGFKSPSNAPNETFDVVTFNIGGYYNISEKLRENINIYDDYFNGKSVLCLQEATIFNNNNGLLKHFNEVLRFPYFYGGNNNNNGVKIFSKYPIINKGVVLAKEQTSNGCVFADIKLDTSIIRVYNFHLQSLGIAPDAQKVIDNPDLEDTNTKKTVKNIAIRLKHGNINRAKDVQVIREHMASCPYPIIVCGDLNDTPYTYSYQTLKGDFKDSFIEAGSGFGVTYDGPIPFLRIDYVFASPSLNVYSHKLVDTNLSDHYLVESSIGF